MIIDVTNEILTRLKNELTDVNVVSSYQSNHTSFPTVTIEELDNSAIISTKDTSGFKHSHIAFRISIFTIGDTRMSDAKKIRNRIDVVMSDEYGFTRGIPRVVPNYLDDSIYRYVLEYTGTIDKNKKIFRG